MKMYFFQLTVNCEIYLQFLSIAKTVLSDVLTGDLPGFLAVWVRKTINGQT